MFELHTICQKRLFVEILLVLQQCCSEECVLLGHYTEYVKHEEPSLVRHKRMKNLSGTHFFPTLLKATFQRTGSAIDEPQLLASESNDLPFQWGKSCETQLCVSGSRAALSVMRKQPLSICLA